MFGNVNMDTVMDALTIMWRGMGGIFVTILIIICLLYTSPGAVSRRMRIALPNIRNPTSATDCGATRPTISVTTIGNAMRIRRLTAPGL